MERYNRNRFVLFIRSNFGESVDSLLDVNFPNVTDIFHIQSFSRSLLREFIRKWGLKLRESEDVTLDQVITQFRELALPLTPFHLTLLFTVYERDSSFRPTNTASLVENFVEFVLGKSTGNLDRGAFDYKNRVTVLAYLAERMIREDNFDVTQVTIYRWVEDYLKGIDLETSVQGVVSQFLSSRIFTSTSNGVQFRHDMFLSYFAAQRMIADKGFFNEVGERPSRFSHEIDIFCGLRRFDESVIEIVGRKFAEVDARLKEQFSILPSLNSLDEFELPRSDTVDAMFSAVTDRLTVSESERDKMLDHGSSDSPAKHKQLARPEANLLAIEWWKTLRSYTIALKNLEEIPADRKEMHLDIILDAWARCIGYLIMLIRMAFESGLQVAGVTISLRKHFGELTPVIARCLFIAAPAVVSSVVRADLGTEKLRHGLSNTDPSGNSSVAVRFVNEALLLDLQLPGFIARTRKYKESITDSRYFSESLLVKLQDNYIRFPLDDQASDQQYRQLLAELTADVLGKRGPDREAAISKQMQEMKKRQIVARLKR